MSRSTTISVLMTTYNRKLKTLACLKSLYSQQLPAGVQLVVHITDDASIDGTPEAVAATYPAVNLHKGTGSLYWAGGMRYTWQQAMTGKPQYYFLVNDDTVLEPNAVATLLKSSASAPAPSICIGSTIDHETGKQSYGGSRLTASRAWKSSMVAPGNDFIHCDFGNANIMLVPAEIVQNIGILSDGYTHSLADYDYTLKAKKAGYQVIIAPGYLGSCKDDHGNNWKSQNVPLKERIQYLKSPKGLAYSEYLLFIRRHFPFSYPSAFCKLWLKTLFPVLWDQFKGRQAVQ
ncbi:glycosyltransferase family 2 protein [Aridibaculum aurantiacum]|uniref:glycosyltransferase family 2 protein n=1 Tax=Aridibaculum aurantiacum TaxID=2810307 RepID=UPI001A967907|nr:glycosyltransferase family 2 protein [Aridibaculum aurantiacum]